MRAGVSVLSAGEIARLVIALGLAAALAGCDGEGEPPFETALTVWNRGQLELLEVRVHDGFSFDEAPNLLAEPLALETSVEVPFVQMQRVTVIRQKNDFAGLLALTTAEGLDVDAPGYTLVVFDKDFRLMEPGY